MINCAHPTHFEDALEDGTRGRADPRRTGQRVTPEPRRARRVVRARRRRPRRARREHAALRRRFPQLTVLGGCCGTDHRTCPRSARLGVSKLQRDERARCDSRLACPHCRGRAPTTPAQNHRKIWKIGMPGSTGAVKISTPGPPGTVVVRTHRTHKSDAEASSGDAAKDQSR